MGNGTRLVEYSLRQDGRPVSAYEIVCLRYLSYFGLGLPGRLPGDIIHQSNWNLEKVRNAMSVAELFDQDFKYRLLTPTIEQALSLQRIWKFGLLVPYIHVKCKTGYFRQLPRSLYS